MMDRPEIPEGMQDPLTYATTARDATATDTVRRAIRHRDVLVAYQPVVQAAAPDRTAFYEGLVRVLDETGRIIPARDFLPAVETTEYGRILDCIALEQGLAELAREPWLRLGINMSARSIGYPPWQRTLSEGLRVDATVGERLILEITEHSAITVPDLVTRFMQDVHGHGVSFAIDDFGAGHSALHLFRDFAFDILKIDGRFVRGIAKDADNQVLVRAMIALAEQFDLFTVAENVETAADAACLAGLGLDCLQGYHFGAPTVHPDWQRSRAENIG